MSTISFPLLRDKTAIVTGGTTGIGRAIVLEYIRQGCSVAANYQGLESDRLHKDSLEQEVDQLRQDPEVAKVAGQLVTIAGDISKPEDCSQLVEAVVQRFGKLDIMVANAGIFKPASFLSLEPQLLEATVNVNILGTFHSCQAAARQMVSQGTGGSIIGVSSISALQGGRYQTHYTPTKAAVLSMMQSMAIALGEHGIRCNALMPGTVRSQLSAAEIENEESKARLLAKIPLARVGEPHDMAGPAVFLASSMSCFMTGAGLLVDGGMFSYLQ